MRKFYIVQTAVMLALTMSASAADLSKNGGSLSAKFNRDEDTKLFCQDHNLPSPPVDAPEDKVQPQINGYTTGPFLHSYSISSARKYDHVYCEVSAPECGISVCVGPHNCSGCFSGASVHSVKQDYDVYTKRYTVWVGIVSTSSDITYWNIFGYH